VVLESGVAVIALFLLWMARKPLTSTEKNKPKITYYRI
jgi:hypothetical protein